MLYASKYSLHVTLPLMPVLFVIFSCSVAAFQDSDLYAGYSAAIAERAQINMRSDTGLTCSRKGLHGLRRITECSFSCLHRT